MSRNHHRNTGRSQHGAKGPTQRQLRVGELVRHALSDILRRDALNDPALEGVSITVSEVRASADLRHAKVFCAPLGGENQVEVVAGLNRSAGYLRGLLGREISLKNTPELAFVSDKSFDEARRIDTLLRSDVVSRDLAVPDDEPSAADEEDAD